MSEPTFVEIQPCQDEALRMLLEEAQLPTNDLGMPGRTFFRYADEVGLIGYVGLEGGGSDILLRSLVVLRSRRRQGQARHLVELAEGVAHNKGVRCLHLLTQDAAPFFRDLGYTDADRAAAPAAIAATAQFTSLCPAGATYLVKKFR